MESRITKLMTATLVEKAAGKPLVALVSTAAPDGVGDVLHQGANDKGAGWITGGFNKRGGRIYWMHNPFEPNLAKARAEVSAEGLLLHVDFDKADPLASTLDRKYREGFLSEWSVGFTPEAGKYAPNDHGGLDFYEQTLNEVSAVNEGMNPQTDTLAKSWLGAAQSVEDFDRRLREVEAVIMRAEKDSEELASARLREMLEDLNRVRGAV